MSGEWRYNAVFQTKIGVVKIKQKSCHKFIYKLHSKRLRDAKWNLILPLSEAMANHDDIVSLNDSQALRFIDEINGVVDADVKAHELRRQIRIVRSQPKSTEAKLRLRHLYDQLYDLQYQKDYVSIIMDSEKDYDRANQGFTINGIPYRRFLGTNGGIKKSTIIYVSERVYPELKRRLDNGRNMDAMLVPAKLEAYQALICSGSIPITPPRGIIVVDDCITHFKADVVLLDESDTNEPTISNVDGMDIEHNDSDGYGIMLPEYAKIVNGDLNGDYTTPVTGFNSRYAWTKGMVFTFDYLDFAEKVAGGNYIVKDAWGTMRDVRDADMIITTSMLKLWDCYDSWEDYKRNCDENHYVLSAAKVTPEELEDERLTNYQFLQSYDFTDADIRELCQPTIDEFKEVLGLDYRKSILYLAGFGLSEKNIYKTENNYLKALMIEPALIYDPYVRKKIHSVIQNRIEMAKKGSIKVNGNFAIVSGDPYSLCQSIFGLEVTGLLRAGEIYHRYWSDRGANEVSCFRAPMTAHHSIRKMKVRSDAETDYWYQYNKTGLILNSWDTTCDAMNGCDFDGDTFFTTNNPVLLRGTKNSKTVICTQKKASKVVPTEADIISANKIAFNDEIGAVTNRATAMYERIVQYEVGSPEYNELAYRITCSQKFQQDTIDRAKGIICKSMPEEWYSFRANKPKDTDSQKDLERKEFNQLIVADKKPYFMIYVYPTLKSEYRQYRKKAETSTYIEFGMSVDELIAKENKTDREQEYLRYYERLLPVGMNPCVVNKIAYLFEEEFDHCKWDSLKSVNFDPAIIRPCCSYSKSQYDSIKRLLAMYNEEMKQYRADVRKGVISGDVEKYQYLTAIKNSFRRECDLVCHNDDELCAIVVDLCYSTESSKGFAWDVCGDIIINHLLSEHDNTIRYPELVDAADGEFVYCGKHFRMSEARLNVEESDDNCE